MKKCPNCNDFALYDDNISYCPICDTALVARSNSRTRESEVVTPRSDRQPLNQESEQIPQFEVRRGFHYEYRGLITEINHHARYDNRLKKWVNAIFRGNPYQFGNTSHRSVIRIEEFSDGHLSERKRDLIFYGDVEGRFNIGDDVLVRAKRRGDRYIITRMYLNETQTRVRPAPQLPALLIFIISILFLVGVFYIVGGLIAFVSSGALLVFIDNLVFIIIFILVILWLLRALIRGRF